MKNMAVKNLHSFLLLVLTTMLIPSFSYAFVYYEVKIVNVATGKHLDSNRKGELYTLDANDGNYQWWRMILVGDGIYTFRNYATGLLLESNADGEVCTNRDKVGDFQKWKLQFNGIGQVYMINKLTEKNLDSNENGKAYTLRANDGKYQLWTFIYYRPWYKW